MPQLIAVEVPVQGPNDSKKQQPEIQRNKTDMTTNDSGDDNTPPPKITTSQIEKGLVRDETTNDLYMPLSSTKNLKQKQKLFRLMNLENSSTNDVLVDSRPINVATAQNE